MLQKEQQLVTATKTPSEFQFKAAMGLSCPDDDSCDPRYAGFFRQVFGSAERYQYYVRHEDQYGFHAGTLNYVQPLPESLDEALRIMEKSDFVADVLGEHVFEYFIRNYSGWFGDPRA